MIKTLIIDDEKLARDVVRTFLEPHKDMELVGECSNGFEAVKAIHELQPDLIFLDVQMPKLTGFEMLELLDHVPVIIFSTAYDEFALKAFEISAVDYLLKPYSQNRFDEALGKARNRLSEQKNDMATVERIHQMRETMSETIQRIVVRNGSKMVIIPVSEIEYIEAQDDYVAIYGAGKKYLKQLTMKYLEQGLPKDQFIRVHRSYIVALDHIDRLEPLSKDTFEAVLKNDTRVPVSRSGFASLKEALKF